MPGQIQAQGTNLRRVGSQPQLGQPGGANPASMGAAQGMTMGGMNISGLQTMINPQTGLPMTHPMQAGMPIQVQMRSGVVPMGTVGGVQAQQQAALASARVGPGLPGGQQPQQQQPGQEMGFRPDQQQQQQQQHQLASMQAALSRSQQQQAQAQAQAQMMANMNMASMAPPAPRSASAQGQAGGVASSSSAGGVSGVGRNGTPQPQVQPQPRTPQMPMGQMTQGQMHQMVQQGMFSGAQGQGPHVSVSFFRFGRKETLICGSCEGTYVAPA